MKEDNKVTESDELLDIDVLDCAKSVVASVDSKQSKRKTNS